MTSITSDLLFGGTEDERNLQALCGPCNLQKGDSAA
jgi:5-methylcytosine-specific restriction endonuclease McrA